MDISDTLEARSDQLNALDIVEPTIFTIESVTRGTAEQPVHVHLVGHQGRPWKPAKGMRRVLAKAWGTDASKWAGGRVELYCDPTVKYAGQPVGGIRISAMTGIDKPLVTPLALARGKREPFTVQPLKAPTFTIPELGTVDEYRTHYQQRQKEGATPQELTAIQHAATTKENN